MATINLKFGQSDAYSFQVLDDSGNTVPSSGYTATPSWSDPSIARLNGGQIFPVKLGTTQLTWTIVGNGSAGYQGTQVLPADTVNVNPKLVVSASVTYAAPLPPM